MISVDADKGTIELEVDAKELARRKAEWKQPALRYEHGAIGKYARLVGPACFGAVTH